MNEIILDLIFALIISIIIFHLVKRIKYFYDITKHKGIKYVLYATTAYFLGYVTYCLIHLACFFEIKEIISIQIALMLFFAIGNVTLTYSLIWNKLKQNYYAPLLTLYIIIMFALIFTQQHTLFFLIQICIAILSITIGYENIAKCTHDTKYAFFFVINLVIWILHFFKEQFVQGQTIYILIHLCITLLFSSLLAGTYSKKNKKCNHEK